jgi:hypothetical protein
MIKRTESFRMSWCVADVVNVHGEHGLLGAYERFRNGPFSEVTGMGPGFSECGPEVIYPDALPGAVPEGVPLNGVPPAPPESLPTPIPLEGAVQEQPPPAVQEQIPIAPPPDFAPPDAVPPDGSLWRRRREASVQPASYGSPQPRYIRPPDGYQTQRLPQTR